MKMITQTIDPRHYDQKVRRIRAQVSAVLTKWGLLPRFKRWRLTQDPNTGMIVLFGILNNRFIATHTSIPFSDYFDARLLHDLADALKMEVVSCNSDGLRYAFILSRGQLGKFPTHIDYPFLDGDKLLARVVYDDQPVPGWVNPQTIPAPPIKVESVDDQILDHQGVAALLKALDDTKLREEATSTLSGQGPPDVVIIEEDEFLNRVAEHKAHQQRSDSTSRG
jgi:hypothetical protein